MASATHEGIVILFRERPALALELLAAAGEAPGGAWTLASIEDATFPQSAPAHRADVVSTFFDDRGRRVLAAIVEVQLGHDADKPWTWPLYWATLRARLRCPVVLVVVAVDRAVARWASRALARTLASGPFGPRVLGPEHIPRITDPEVARRTPELAVLSSLVHGNERDGEHIAVAALEAVARLDAPRSALYHDLVRHGLNAAATAALEALMGYKGYEYQSDFAKKYFGEGVAAGRAEGVAAGRAEGVAGLIDALLALMAARALTLDEAQLLRIRACNDLGTLQAWVTRAARASTVAEVLD
jgi:hypothetical protein